MNPWSEDAATAPVTDIWHVKPDDDREQWELRPDTGVGPLRFGMRPDAVREALGTDQSIRRRSTSPSGKTRIVKDRFQARGISVHYSDEALACVAVHALVGPQVRYEGVPLTGRVPSELEAWLTALTDERGLDLRYAPDASPCSADLGLLLRVQRAGDVLLTRPLVLVREWTEVLWDSVPSEEWHAQ